MEQFGSVTEKTWQKFVREKIGVFHHVQEEGIVGFDAALAELLAGAFQSAFSEKTP